MELEFMETNSFTAKKNTDFEEELYVFMEKVNGRK